MKAPPSLARASRVLAGLCLLGWAAGCAPVATKETPDVVVDPAVRHQELVGFGAALGWYQESLVAHAQAEEIYTRAFADLGLDILRFRNRFGRSSEAVDLAAEVTILEQATASLGHAPAVLLTSWSPPGELKQSGREDCNGDTAGCTLARDGSAFAYDAFAAYWADSLTYYRAQGISPTWVSLQNEPDFTPGSWEGCRFAPTETGELPGYDRALEAVHARLADLPEPPALVGPETLGVHYQKVEEYLRALDPSLLGAVAHHLYEQGSDGVWDWRSPGPDSYISPMRGASAAAGGLPVFQTEFQTDGDEGIEGGFETAWLIQNELAEASAAAFLYWDLVWPQSGLIALEGNEAYTLRDQYFAVRHFARYTEPGDVRVGVESSVLGLRASAFLAPDGSRLTTVVLNVGSETQSAVFELGDFAPERVTAIQTVFDPGQSETWVELGTLDGALELPPRSVTTLVAE